MVQEGNNKLNKSIIFCFYVFGKEIEFLLKDLFVAYVYAYCLYIILVRTVN